MHHGASYYIVFAGGGTGGHLFPGLAVAERLAEQTADLRITFAGIGKALERREVAAAGWQYFVLPSRPGPQRPRDVVPFVFQNLIGYFAARRFLEKENVTAVVGLGGYASAPLAQAAARRRIPLVLLEQNVAPGRATRWLARSADRICTSFPSTEKYLPQGRRVQCTGNPLRRDFENILPKKLCRAPPQLLVLGGSSGARTLNEHVPGALARIGGSAAGWRILHQTGEADLTATRARYEQFGLPAATVPFFDNLPEVLAETDLVISRAGGTAMAEFAAGGIPAVLIPYPYARDRHQEKNAAYFVEAGAAVALCEQAGGEAFSQALSAVLKPLLADSASCRRFAHAMRRLGRRGAAAKVAALILSEADRGLRQVKNKAA